MFRTYILILISSFFSSCQSNKTDKYELARINDSTHVKLETGEINKLVCLVNDSLTSTWPIEYPLYQFQSGDIDNNGTIDLAVGVIKTTRYDSVKRNRLFLYQIRNEAIIPLWLGTSVGHPIVDFRMIQNAEGQYFIRVLAKEKSDNFLVADYEWYGFGLSLTHYIKREVSIDIAEELLYTHI